MAEAALLVVSAVHLRDAPPVDVRKGLVGFVSCVLNDSVRVEGLTLRRTRRGRPSISFPLRRDSQGRKHPVVCLLRREDRRAIEDQIFRALGIQQEAAP